MKGSIRNVAVAFLGVSMFSVAVGQDKKPPPDYVKYDKAPEAVKKVQPHYPDLATLAGVEGTVWVNAWIDESGKVVQAIVQKSDAEVLNQSAVEAAQQWQFKPALSDGKPIAVWVMLPFRFKLSEGEKKGTASSGLKATKYPPAEDAKYDQEPVLVSQVQPKYPDGAILKAVEGTVYTKMWVDESGKVVQVIVTKSDNEVLNEAAMDAGMQWLFKPALNNGKPVAVWITVPWRFALSAK